MLNNPKNFDLSNVSDWIFDYLEKYSIEIVTVDKDGNVNCINCVDSKFCFGCKNCINCHDCFKCVFCKNCLGVANEKNRENFSQF